MSVENFYYSGIGVYVAPTAGTNDWGGPVTPTDDGYTLNRTISGFIQRVSGNTNLQNAKRTEKVSARLYTSVAENITTKNLIKDPKTSRKYWINTAQYLTGISTVEDHQEILLEDVDT